MAERKQAKRERRQAAGGEGAKAARRQANETGEQTKGARRGARAGGAKSRARPSGGAQAASHAAPGGGNGEAIESRLARIEEAVSAQSQLSEELLAKLDEVLEEARRPAS
jgi:hypothetical protein